MRTQATISILTAAALALTSMSAVAQGRHGQGGAQPQDRAQIERGQRDFDRDRFRDRDRITNAPDNAGLGQNGIYGGELMSTQERNQYREQLRLTENDPQARTKFMAEHNEQMQQRAREKGVDLKDPPDNGNDN
jgi:hypothetical protein